MTVPEIVYNNDNYADLLQLIAAQFKTRVQEHTLYLPEQYGEGYIWGMNMGDGMSVLLMDAKCKQPVQFKRVAGNSLFYIFQFNETQEEEEMTSHVFEKPVKTSDAVFTLQQNVVMLTSSQMTVHYTMPQGIRLRSVKIIIEKKLLQQFLEPHVLDTFLSTYFSQLVKTGNVEPIDADYRVLMDALLRSHTQHPLPFTYITNRCMLLLEHFIVKFMKRAEGGKAFSRLKDDEINRLMRVEAQLVKDYTQQPPTIETLSKLAAMSPTKLKKDFKELYGLPIYEYFQKNRMKHARSLLMEGRYSVKEVGTMVGYTNLSHFAGSFKKEFGLLPSSLGEMDETLTIERLE